MRQLLMTVAALTLLAGVPTAQAQKIDANGKCHGADGKMAKMEVCKPPAAAAKTQCRDVKTKKFAKCDAPGTEPVPAKAK